MTRAEFIERLKKLIEEAENDERTAESVQNVPNDDLISRKAAIDELRRDIRLTFISSVVEMLVVRVKNLPAVQTEPIEQIKWERDTAIQQLADLGYGLGEKPRTDGDAISRRAAIDAISKEGTRLERNGTVAMAEIKQWCVDILEALPSVQPKLPKNWWKTDHGYMWLCPHCGLPVHSDFEECLRCGIKRQSAQPERKRGKWEVIKAPKGYCDYMSCSVCHADFIEDEEYKYCPNCGAYMRGEQKYD